MKHKNIYVAPSMDVIPVEPGCVMAASIPPSSSSSGSYTGGHTFTRSPHNNAASSADIDNLINDILTVEQ